MSEIISPKVEQEFVQKVQDLFGKDRIICILFYGTNAFKRNDKEASDYDFYIMLDHFTQEDDALFKNLVNQFGYISLDLAYQYLSDIEKRGWRNYQLGNHGVFYILNFAQAKLMYGYNIFQRKLVLLERSHLNKSILNQIQEYFWRLDNWYLKELSQNILEENFKKYLIRICIDILLLNGDISFQEINQSEYKDIALLAQDKAYFSSRTKDLFISCFDDQIKENTIASLRDLQRSVYEDYLNLYN